MVNGTGLEALFTRKAEAAGSHVLAFPSLEAGVAYLTGWLAGEGLVKVAASVDLPAALDRSTPVFSTVTDLLDGAALDAALVTADYGVAGTGTLVRLERGDAEKMLWTLPPVCLCLLDRQRLLPDLESLLTEARDWLSRDGVPGPQLSLITGPSRTADIECELSIGVHGPGRLIILLYGEPRP